MSEQTVDFSNDPVFLERQQAEQALMGALNERKPNEIFAKPMDIKALSLRTGEEDNRRHFLDESSDKKTTHLVLNVSSSNVEKGEGERQKFIDATYEVLKEKVPALAANVAFDKPEDHAAMLMERLQTFKDAGANLPYDVSQFRIFDNKVIGQNDWVIQDHAAQGILKEDKKLAYTFTVYVPEKPMEGEAKDSALKDVLDNLNAHKPEELAKLAKKIAEYTPNLNETQKQELEDTIRKMDISFEAPLSGTLIGTSGAINVTLRTPAQTKAFNELKASETPSEAKIKELDDANPLTKISEKQFGKAVGRAILHYGPDAAKIFPIIAGREDVARDVKDALTADSFRASIAGNEDLVKKVDEFIKDDALKAHEMWDKPKAERVFIKKPPEVSKPPKEFGALQIDFTLPEKVADEVLAQIKTLKPEVTQAEVMQQGSAPTADVANPDITPGGLPNALAALLNSGAQAPGSRAMAQNAGGRA